MGTGAVGNSGYRTSGGAPGMNRTQQPEAFRPSRDMQTTTRPDGTQLHRDLRTNTSINTDRSGRVMAIERPGLRATDFRADGRPAHIERASGGGQMVVDRGLRGERRVEVVHPDGLRVVSVGSRAYVERPYRAGYVSRTYFVGSRSEVAVYRSYRYRSVAYVTYVPPVTYQPAFYGWAARPWGAPVVYSWGYEANAPWYYSGYYSPQPVYPGPALWLTDFVLAANLRAGYNTQPPPPQQQQFGDAQQMNPGEFSQNAGGSPLTPEIKAALAEEVRQQLMAGQQQQQQQSGAAPYPMPQPPMAPGQPPTTAGEALPPALKQRMFVVSSNLDVTGAGGGGQPCGLTAGDIIQRVPRRAASDSAKVVVEVMSSKPGDCPAEFETEVDIAALQEMSNEMQRQLASGMQELAQNEGKRLPPGPAPNARPSADGQVAPGQRDESREREMVDKLNTEADQTEAEIRKSAAGGGNGQ